MNKEIEELLNKLEYASECDDFIIEIRKDRAKLLLSYIEQLEKELKEEQEDNYKQSEWLVKKQKKIEQLETDCKEANESVTWWQNRFNAVEKENEQLKKQKDDGIKYIKSNCIVSDEWTELDFCNFVPTGKVNYKALNKEKVKVLLRMLGEIDENR